MALRKWPAAKLAIRATHLTFKGILSIILVLVLTFSAALIGVGFGLVFDIPTNDRILTSIGLGAVTTIIGVGIVLNHTFGSSQKGRGLVDRYPYYFENIDKNWGIAVHIIIYSIIAGVFTAILIYFSLFIGDAILDRMHGETELSNNSLNASLKVFEVLGLLIPIWIVFVNLGVRSYLSPNNNYEHDEVISPAHLMRIAMGGYIALIVAFASVYWELLPILPDIVGYSMIIVLVALIIVALNMYDMYDQMWEEHQSANPKIDSNIGYR